MIIIFYFISRLRKIDGHIVIARKETKGILDTVQEGLFLLNDELMISGGYSSFSEKLFNLGVSESISGKIFLIFWKIK